MLSDVVKEFICHMRIFFLTLSELRFAIKGFALMVILFFVIEFLICQLDDSSAACRLVGLSSVDCSLPSPYLL